MKNPGTSVSYFRRLLVFFGFVAEFNVAALPSDCEAAGNRSMSDDSATFESVRRVLDRRTKSLRPPTGGPDIKITIGMSISLFSDGLLDKFTCFWCFDSLGSAKFWTEYLEQIDYRTVDDRRINIQVTRREDYGLARKMILNYEELCTGDNEVDFLFGPSYGLFNVYAARIAQKYKKLLILWAFDEGDSRNYLLNPGPEVLHWQSVVPNATSITDFVSTEPGYLAPLPQMDEIYNGGSDPGQIFLGVNETYRDSDDYGNYSFNVNHKATLWAMEAILFLYERGSRTFVFINPTDQNPDFYGYGAQPYYESSARLANYTSRLPQTRCTIFNLSMNMLASVGELREYMNTHVFVFSGDLQDQKSFTINLKASGVRVFAVLFDRPYGQMLVNASTAYLVNYFFEAFPMSNVGDVGYQDPVFGSTFEWTVRYRTSSAFQDHVLPGTLLRRCNSTLCREWGTNTTYPCCIRGPPDSSVCDACPPRLVGFASLQVAAAASLLTQALQHYAMLDSSERTERIIQYLRENETETVMGEMMFDETGHRILLKESMPSIRQYIPISPPLGSPEWRYYQSHIIWPRTVAEISYPMKQWYEKQIEVFPCRAGCFFYNENCIPCSPGSYRDPEEIDCRTCLDRSGAFSRAGAYTHNFGSPSCLPVSYGGELRKTSAGYPDPSSIPVAMQYFYPVSHDNPVVISESDVYLAPCVADNNTYLSVEFTPCIPKNLCQGGDEQGTCVGLNTGVLCGDCRKDSTWRGPFLGLRRCVKCNLIWTYTFIFLVFALFVAMQFFLSRSAEHIAFNSGSVGCAAIRILLHWAHMMGFALGGTSLDSHPVIAYSFVMVHVLCRPLEVMQIDCLLSDNSGNKDDTIYRDACLIAIPAGAGFFILKPFFKTALRVIKTSFILAGKGRLEKNATHRRTTGKPLSMSDEAWDKALKANPYLDPTFPLNLDLDRSIVKGSGRRFAFQHETWEAVEYFQTFVREICCYMILVHPVVYQMTLWIRACTHISAFEQDGTPHRSKINFGVVCNSLEHNELMKHVEAFHWAVLIFFFAILGIAWFTGQSNFFSLKWRVMFSVIFEGHRPDRISWELWASLRILALYEINARSDSMMMRAFFMLVVVLVSIMLLFWMRPYDLRDREGLMGLELKSNVSLAAVLAAGIAVQMELPDTPDSVTQNPESLGVVSMALWLSLPLLATAWFVMSLVRSLAFDAALNVEILLQYCSYNIDSFTHFMMRLIKRFFRGMNPVLLYVEDDRVFIDVSRLDKSERRFLVKSLITTLTACIDSTTNFHTFLFENAIKEGFLRAKQVRVAKFLASYYKHGSNPYYLVDFGIFKIFKVQLRPPDIGVGFHGQDDQWHQGVTVEELQAALSTVDIDIMSHDPHLFRVEQNKTEEQNVAEVQNVVIWNPGASLATLEDDLRQQGTVDLSGHAEEPSWSRQSSPSVGNDILEEMASITKQQRDLDESMDEIRLEDALHSMEFKVRKLEDDLFTFRDRVELSSLTKQQRSTLDSLSRMHFEERHMDPEMREEFHRHLRRRNIEPEPLPSALKDSKDPSQQLDTGWNRSIARSVSLAPETYDPQPTLYRVDTPALGMLPSTKQTSI